MLLWLLAGCPTPQTTETCHFDKRMGDNVCVPKSPTSKEVEPQNCFDENGYDLCPPTPVKPKDEYIAPSPRYNR